MPKRRRENGSDDSESDEQHDAENEDEALRDTLQEAVNASVAAARRRGGEERARLVAEATAAAKVTAEVAATRIEAEEMKRVVEQDRAALEAEKASMEKAHTFQNSTIVLSVGGHRFETSRQTLTSVSGSYLASMFSGRCNIP